MTPRISGGLSLSPQGQDEFRLCRVACQIFLLTIEAAVLSPSELVVVFNYPARRWLVKCQQCGCCFSRFSLVGKPMLGHRQGTAQGKHFCGRIAEPENTTWSCPDLWEEETDP